MYMYVFICVHMYVWVFCVRLFPRRHDTYMSTHLR